MLRHLFRALLPLALGAALAGPVAAACTDRQPPAERPAGVPARLPELLYECVALEGNGRSLWMGETGRQHDTTVLLVHGLGHMAHRDWRNVVGPLSRRFHVIAIDLPGFGASDALPDGYSFAGLDRVLDEVVSRFARGGRAHVVGHSLGGAVSLNFAHRHAARVDRLVLVDAAGILLMNLYALPPRLAIPEVGFTPVDRLMRRMDAGFNGLSRSVAGRVDDRMDPSRWLERNPMVRNALLGPYTQVDAAVGLVQHDFSEAVFNVQAPTTLIWGRDDPVAPLRTGRLLAARMPQARLEVIPDTGHAPMTQRPAAFEPLLMQALTGPVEPRDAAVPAIDTFQGGAQCDARLGARYTGRLGLVELRNCQDVVIRDAHLDGLVLNNSSVMLDNVAIVADGVAVDARRSHVTATNVNVSGQVGLRTDGSTLDLAGARITAEQRAVEVVNTSWIYFSISEMDAPELRGKVHRVWPGAPSTRP